MKKMLKYKGLLGVVACAVAFLVVSNFYIEKNDQLNQKIIQEQEHEIEGLLTTISEMEEETDKHRSYIDAQNSEISNLRSEVDSARRRITETRADIENTKKRTIKVKVTGYCPCEICCGEWAYKNPGITASGTKARYGTIAAPKSIPFGTKMKIEGYGDKVFTVEDTGSAVVYKNGVYVIDMWMPTHEQAYAVGNKIVTAVVLE